MRSNSAIAVCLSAIWALPFTTLAQSPAPAPTPCTPNLTDVTVTDSSGNPVRNLSRSAFHIFDDKKPQNIASFEEHTGSQPELTPTAAPSAPHTFSNDYLLHPPPVFNAIVLDTVTIDIDIVTQMYLYKQLTDFINALPPQNSLAIFIHNGQFTLLLQDFTTDHALLLTAIRKAVPILPIPGAWYENRRTFGSFLAMQQIAIYLGQLPGRKNVLWYSAGSSLFLNDVASKLPSSIDPHVLRAIYDELEASRIALYPIDVRGLQIDSDVWENILMDDEAKATGGRAYYKNDLTQFSLKTIATDADFYTLTYSPADFKLDDKWHNVKVTLDGGPYTLSYRTGYYGDGASSSDPNETKKMRILLTSNGDKFQRPANYDQPIIFQAEVQPTSSVPVPENAPTPTEKKNEISYTIRYTVPATDFVQQNIPDGQRVQIGAALVAFNQYGRPITRLNQKFTLNLNGDKLTRNPNANLYFDQQFTLPKGQDYLFVAVWDPITSRLGTIQVPVNVEKQNGPKH
jgi:VWFA-related protein